MPRNLLSAVLLAVLSAGRAQAAPVELTYWSSTNPEEIALAKKLVGEWNGAHPDVQVKLQPIPQGRSSEEVLLAAVVALDEFPDWASFVKSRMDERMLAPYRSKDGHFYQLPWKANPVMMAYNADYFAAKGLTPPKTYSQFMAVAEKIARERDELGKPMVWPMNPSPLAIWWQRLFDVFPFYIAASSGKTLFQGDAVIFDNPDAVAVMRFFRECFARGYFPNTGNQLDIFVQQQAAMSVVGPWAIKYYERAMTRRFRIDFAPVPVPDGKTGPVYTYGDPKNIALFKTSKHPREAWEFAKFLVSKQADHDLLAMTDQIPLRKNLISDPFFKDVFDKNPVIRKFAAQAAYTAPTDDTPNLVEILDYLGQQYEACAVYGKISPEEAVKRTADYAAGVNADL